jgi:PAS domain S-box-containing protein
MATQIGEIRQPRSTLRLKLGGPLALMVLVTVALGVYMAWSSYQLQVQHTQARQRQASTHAADQVSSYVSLFRAQLEDAARGLVYAGRSTERQSEVLEQVLDAYAHFNEIAFVNFVGQETSRVVRGVPTGQAPLRSHAVPGLWPAVDAALAGKVYLGQVYISTKPGVPFVQMAVPTYDADGAVNGSLLAEVDLSYLQQVIKDVRVSEEDIYVVDGEGRLIAYHDSSVLLMPGSNQALRPVEQVPAVQSYLQSRSVSSGVMRYISGLRCTLGDQCGSVMAYYRPIENTDWIVVVEQPLSSVYAEANGLLIWLAIPGVIIIALMGGFVWYLQRGVLSPISELSKGAAALAGGQWEQRLGIYTGDEIQMLAEEFNTMADSLRRSQAELENVALEKSRQAEVAQKRVMEISRLIESGRAITSLDLEDVLKGLAFEMGRIIPIDQCLIYLKDEDRDQLVVRGRWGLGEGEYAEAVLNWGESAAGWAAREGHELFLTNVQADPRFMPKTPADRSLSSLLALPLKAEDGVVGVLQVATQAGKPGLPSEIMQQLDPFANQVTIAYKNARLYEEERHRAQEMKVVAGIMHTISASLDLSETLDLILQSIREVVPYDRSQINLWEASEKVLRTHAQGGRKDANGNDVYRLDEGFTGWIARNRRPLVVADVQSKSPVRPKIDLERVPLRAYAGVPLVLGNDLVGTLELVSYKPNAFETQHVETLQTVANQAAVAIHNARLYEETRRGAREMAALREAVVEITSRLEPQRIAHAIVERATVLLYGQSGVLYQVDADQRSLTLVVSYNMPRQLVGATIHFGEGLSGRIAQKRQPMIVNDYRHWEGRAARFAEEPFTAIIGAPLIWQDELIGVINVLANAEHRRFNESDLRLITMFGSQVAVTLQNANLYEQVRRRVEEMSTLHEASADLASELNPERLLDSIIRRATELLRAGGGGLYRYNPYDQMARLIASCRVEQDYLGITLKRGEGLVGHIVQDGQPLIINDYPSWDERASQGENAGFTAVMGAPLIWQDQLLGVLTVMDDVQRHTFNLSDLRLLTLFANQAVVALRNADLFAETRRRVTELDTLADIGQALSSTLREGELLQLIYEQTRRVMYAEHMFIALYDQANAEVEVVFSRADELAEGTRFPADEGLTGHIIKHRRSILLGENVAERVRQMGLEVVGQPAASWLGAPMLTGDRVLGVIVIQHYTDPYAYDDSHRILLEAIASQAAIALENARLYKLTDARLQQRVQELTGLAVISQELNTTFELERIFELVLDEAQRATHAEYGVVYLLNADTGNLDVRATYGYPADRLETISGASLRYGAGVVGRVVESARPALVNDVSADPNYLRFMPDTQSELCVPISYATLIVGAINLESTELHHFSTEDSEYVQALASQAAIAIGNAQRREEQLQHGELLRRRVEQLSTLFEIGQAFRSDRPLADTLEEVAYAIQTAVGFDIVIISVLEGDPPLQRRVAAAGIPVMQFEQMKERRQPWEAVRAVLRDEFRISQSYYIPAEQHEATESLDTFDLVDAADQPRQPGQWHPQDVLLAPLRGGQEHILGVISVDAPRDGAIPNRPTIETLEVFANQAAVIIENTRLYADLERRIDEIRRLNLELEQRVQERTEDLRQALDQLTVERDRVETLFRITSELQASLDLDRVLNHALTLVNENIQASRAVILLTSPQSDTLSSRALIDVDQGLSAGETPMVLRRGDGLAGWSVRRRKPAVVPDVLNDPYWIPEEGGPQADARSALVVPLITADDVLGVLLMTHREPHYFTEAHSRLAEAAAAQMATAINNAELYRMIRESAERLGQMLRSQQEEASKSQAILEGVAEGVMVADRRGKIILFNAAAERILGLRRGETIGRSTDDLLGLYGAGGTAWLNAMREWASSTYIPTEPVSFEQSLQIEDKYVRASIAPVMMGEEYLGAVSVFRDTTKEVEVDRAKNEFVSTVSHELRTPMTSIKGYADLLMLGAAGPLAEGQLHFMSIIKSNADRLSELVNDLLNISRLEAGRVALDVKPLRLDSLIEQVVNSLRGKIEEKGLTISTSVPDNLPAVNGDNDRVIQILTNLVSNAYQYTRHGGSITVRAQLDDAMIRTEVIDTGVGISPEDQKKVFDRFFRSDDDYVQEFGGTGLGLAIVKQLVELHHGQLDLESQVGVGTSFSFTLPVAEG